MSASVVVVSSAAIDSVQRGHPWVWAKSIVRADTDLAPGAEAKVTAEDGSVVGYALADPKSPIFLRMWSTAAHGEAARIDARLFERRLARALALRASILGDETNAVRLLHGEGDRMPGFVVDRYASVAVLRADGEGAAAREGEVATALWPLLEREGVTTLVAKDGPSAGVRLLRGAPCPEKIEAREHGVPFVVDVVHGQKTGAFLDQRENRRRVGALARGRRVLNLFSYAGGFSLHAALGGATHVTSVDVAARAHATAQASFRLAGIDPRAHAFVTADAFAFLAEAKKKGTRWDLVVSDPPSFAPSEKALARAIQAYRSLHRACAAVLADDGYLCASSCSSHVDARAFAGTLDDAALGRADLRLLELHGPPRDHPTLAAWPEGRYLKFAVLS